MRGRSEQDPSMIRDRSDHESVSPQPAAQQRLLFALRTTILYWKIQHFALRLSFQISPSTAPATQSDTWTSPSTAPSTKSVTWTSPSTAPATKSDTWPSPSTAPATQNDSQAWSSSHMKRHFQCEEQQMSPSKLTKYCACHAKWPSNIWQKFAENSWNVISNARPIRPWSEHDPRPFRDRSETVPRPFPSVRNPPRNRGYFSLSGRAFCVGKCNISSSGYLSKFHQVLRLPRKVTLELHQVLRLPRKVTLELHQVLRLPRKVTLELHQVLRLARQVTLEFHQVVRLPRKVTLELHQVLRLPRKVTLELHQVLRLPRKVTLELHQVLRLARQVTLELHQVLRLPRKVTLDLHQVLRLPHRMTRRLDPRHIWNVISNARSNKCHPPNSPNTAPATQNDRPTSGRNLRKTAETSFPMRGRSDHDPSTIRDRSETVPRPFRDRSRQSATRHATEVTFRAQD